MKFKTVAGFLATGLIIQLMILVFLYARDYEGRQKVAESAQAGCLRAKADRISTVTIGDNVLKVFADSNSKHAAMRNDDRSIYLGKISSAVEDVKKRTKIVCSSAYPPPELIP